MTYTITKEIEFDAGHRVPQHASKCRNPHGHRYKVVAVLKTSELVTTGSETGMVKDFGIIKEVLTEHVHDVFDHAFIMSQLDGTCLEMFKVEHDADNDEFYSDLGFKIVVVNFDPTAENLARYIYWVVKRYIPQLHEIIVFETPTSSASYKVD